MRVLEGGGNAVDAAVAANLALGVVTPYLCGYGGDLFAIVWEGRALAAYDGAGGAPAAATPETVRAALGGADRMPLLGAHTVTVPGAVDGWFALLERFGSRSFAELAEPAQRLAREGFTLSERGARTFGSAAQRFGDQKEWQRIYGGARAGAVLPQTDLARTIEVVRDGGRDAYYRGEIARAIGGELRGRGALMTEADLAEHRGGWVEPISVNYRGVEIFELPPPTQGVAVLQALAILDGLPRATEHVAIESFKWALSDAAANVTDPAHMRIDVRALLSPVHVAEQRAHIDPVRASSPPPWPVPGGGTAYLCAADAGGMVVSMIQSNFAGFGSGITVPGWGINLQNRGTFFSLDPSHANVIAPRKRTLHTLIPAIAFRDARPWMVFGTMGGQGQAQTHVQLLVRMIDDGADPQEAIDAPRWVCSTTDWRVAYEPRFPDEVIEGLRARGHVLRALASLDAAVGHAHAIQVTEEGYAAATDPRAEGAALGF